MKKYITNIVISLLAGVTLFSCSDFFDNQPDNTTTIEEVFERRQSSMEFLSNVYSYIRPPYNWSNETIWAGVCDEIDVTYSDYEISKINLGLLGPDREDLFYGNLWRHYYPGIRAATYFMNNIHTNIEMTEEEILRCKAEARALRAWFYFCLVRQYGPVVILSDDLIDSTAPTEEMEFPRSSIKTCFDFIVSELDDIVAMKVLPVTEGSALEYGRMTEAICKAIKAKTLLYAASDLYNRDKTLDIIKEFKNIDGSYMMDYTDEGAKERWEAAAKAAKEVIDYSAFDLYRATSAGQIDPYRSYQELFYLDSNQEVIWARPKGNFWEQDRASSPRFVNGWSGWGVLQEMVDSYFTKTGYPLKKKADGTLYAEDGSYTEEGFSESNGDDGYTQRGTYNMYTNREPRFYISICFDNSKWLSDYNQSTVEFYYGGNTGRTEIETRNYSQTGYLCRKFVHPNSNVANDQLVEHCAILIRLGEIYLNYVEALNEADYDNNLSEILIYLNLIRERAGIPGYGTAANMVPVPANQEEMREAIRRERRVELAFEEARYFDCVRWAIAHKEFDGPKHGMNANDSRGKDVFYQRTAFEERKFKAHNTLWPIPLSDVYKSKKLVQNPEWSTFVYTN